MIWELKIADAAVHGKEAYPTAGQEQRERYTYINGSKRLSRCLVPWFDLNEKKHTSNSQQSSEIVAHLRVEDDNGILDHVILYKFKSQYTDSHCL